MRSTRPPNPIASCAVVALLAAGCAMGNGDRRRVLNHLDERWTPATATGRWLAAPVALPVGVVGLAADAVVVHPLSQLDDAWGDTVEVLWEFDDESGFRRVLLTPLAALATPVVFGVDWLGRAVFDIGDRLAGEDAGEDDGERPDAEGGR